MNINREEILTRSAASRLVGYEYRQQMKGVDYSGSDSFVLMVMEWLATSRQVAEEYAAITSESKLVGGDIPDDVSMEMRINQLTLMAMKDGKYESS